MRAISSFRLYTADLEETSPMTQLSTFTQSEGGGRGRVGDWPRPELPSRGEPLPGRCQRLCPLLTLVCASGLFGNRAQHRGTCTGGSP